MQGREPTHSSWRCVEVDPAQQRTGSLGDGADAPLVEGGLGAAELHHPGDAKAVADGRAGHALGREVDRAVGDVLGGTLKL